VSDSVVDGWKGDEALPALPPYPRIFEEQLVLLDRIAGLEAQVAELRRDADRTPSEALSAEQLVIQMQSSFAWRLGNALTDPRRAFRRIFRR
jgi:hypothetical protein